MILYYGVYVNIYYNFVIIFNLPSPLVGSDPWFVRRVLQRLEFEDATLVETDCGNFPSLGARSVKQI